jgi:polysaccharide biosynthesis/export protein
MKKKLLFVAAGFLALAAAGAPSARLLAQQKEKEKEQEPVLAREPITPGKPPTSTEGGAAPVDPKSYRIGPEDVLQVRVWREPELSGVFIVRPDGVITLPLAGEIKAGDLTPEQLKEKVTDAYGKFVNRPEVMVSVQAVMSKKYYLVGEVNKPGLYPLIVPTTILEALNGAGGFREFAKKGKITILRGSERLKFNWDDVIKGKKMEQNIQVQNGDHIIVP